MEIQQAFLQKALSKLRAATGGSITGRESLRGFDNELKLTFSKPEDAEFIKENAGKFGLEVVSHYEPQFVRLLSGD